jgi:hypothetical protein
VDIAYSINGVPIRLTDERWLHIIERHNDLVNYFDDILATVENPDLILPGYGGSLYALRAYGRQNYLAVVYREVSPDDGFIITAYFMSRVDRRKAIWRRQ